MEQIRIVKEMRDESARQLRMRGADDIRGNIRCRFLVWENVCGAFSSNSGRDFQAVLEEIAKVAERDACIPGPPNGKWPYAGCIMGSGWSIAWRIHDGQFWGTSVLTPDGRVVKRGTPQRRKRISLVADFGGQSAPEILFERKGLPGNLEPCGEKGQGVTSDTERSIDPSSYTLKIRGGVERDSYGKKAGKGALVQTELSGTLGVSQDQTLITTYGVTTKGNGDAFINPDTHTSLSIGGGQAGQGYPCVLEEKKEPVLLESNQNHATIQTDGVSTTLPASMGMGGGYVPMVLNDQGGSQMSISEDKTSTLRAEEHGHQPIVFGISSYDSNSMKSPNPNSGIYEADTTRTLDLNGGNPACNQGGMAVVCLEGNGSRESHKGDGYKESETMYTLNTVEQHAVCIENHPNDSRCKISEDGVVQTLSSRMGTGGNNTPMVMETYQKTTGSLCASGYNKLGTQEAANDMYVVQSSWDGSQISPTLTANNANGAQRMPDKDNFNAVIQSMEVFHCTTDEDKVQTLKARDYKDPQVVAYGLDRASYNQGINAKYDFAIDEEKVGTQTAMGPGAVCASYQDVTGSLDCCYSKGTSNQIATNDMLVANTVVRRLTPLECERLQGFPDFWTDIGDWVDSKGKKHKGESDSPRYKALGNSICLPFWSWMSERMIRVLKDDGVEHPTMASLFDGIGGFPLVYSRCGCEPIWASEIEEFPIAVTKVRFKDDN